MTTDRYYPLAPELVTAVRRADVLTGEFLRPVPSGLMAGLRAMGLTDETASALSERGRVVRSWLMRGTDLAPREVARLLGSGTGMMA